MARLRQELAKRKRELELVNSKLITVQNAAKKIQYVDRHSTTQEGLFCSTALSHTNRALIHKPRQGN